MSIKTRPPGYTIIFSCTKDHACHWVPIAIGTQPQAIPFFYIMKDISERTKAISNLISRSISDSKSSILDEKDTNDKTTISSRYNI